MAALPKPQYVSCTETSTTLKIACEQTGLTLEYKEYPEEWSSAKSVPFDGTAENITVDGLNPGSTYNFRLTDGSTYGADLVVDTQSTSCTPKPKRCSIL
mmetsp:Transcript_3882/g.9947  ORF Transcript_3882/g.9947 Transcript_3882/m.9947 type:complete len:99 (+) Transcript_3882:34-330(+)